MFEDEIYMKKAVNLAKKGEGYTSPNPLVGAVVVKNGEIIGTGYHQYCGGPHAEVYALDEAGEKARGGKIYVNLEPCCHFGKTPPCTDKIIKSGIKKVIIGMEDPDPRVQGKGIEKLKKAGIEVKSGVLEKEAKKLNEIFIKYKTTNYPYVIMKSALTLDGFLATSSGDSKWITNKKARKYGHKLRHKVDGILVGAGTVLNDNPRLTTRLKDKEGKDSMRIVLDSNLKIPLDSKIINHNSSAETLIITGNNAPVEKLNKLCDMKNVEIKTFRLNNAQQIPLKKLLRYLHDREITSILVEGGGKINYSFLNSNLGDKVYYFIASRIYGGNDGISVFEGKGPQKMEEVKDLKQVEYQILENNILIKAYLPD
ncbi:MAG: bifunctional diaminohydroxyphosphoribosylaminopyrimidine deaminase/5-amino-6-(5-phosphoribosylamino)uracil reductase RibD [Bacillota bacterium]